MNWYLKVLKNYFVFSGRARRKEYWMFVLFNILAAIVLAIVDNVAGTVSETGQGLLGGIYTLAVLCPSIAVGVRRLHDTGRSGLWFLIAFVPCIGAIVLLVFFVQAGTAGPNEYGPDPKAEETEGSM